MTRPDPALAHTRESSETVRPTAPTRSSRRIMALVIGLIVLLMLIAASLAIGSRSIPPGTVIDALVRPDGSEIQGIVTGMRLPRTLLGLVVGAALGVSGALMQAFTRNPLADPGVLGVNAGAALAVSIAVAVFGFTGIGQFLPFAFVGAIAATVVVYGIARRGGGGATPLRLTLVGVALAAAMNGISSTLALLRPDAFNAMRFWGAGSIADRPPETLAIVAPVIGAGLILAMMCARPLNAFALGDDLARTLGTGLTATRILTIAALTLLAGAATAAAGPIAFVGLMVPHAVRWFTGPDQRWIILLTMIVSPSLLLIADIAGRLVVWPAELQVGIVVALIGAPVLIALARRRSARGL